MELLLDDVEVELLLEGLLLEELPSSFGISNLLAGMATVVCCLELPALPDGVDEEEDLFEDFLGGGCMAAVLGGPGWTLLLTN